MKKAQYFITCSELPMRTVNEMTPQGVRNLLVRKPKKKYDDRQLTLDFGEEREWTCLYSIILSRDCWLLFSRPIPAVLFRMLCWQRESRYLYSMMRLLRWFPMKRKRVGFGAVYRKNCLHPPCPALPNAGWRKSRKRHRSCFVISVKQ